MVKLVDALVSNTSIERCVGSSPTFPTFLLSCSVNGNMTDSDSVVSGSTPDRRTFYGGCRLMVRTGACGASNASSILVIYPFTGTRQGGNSLS